MGVACSYTAPGWTDRSPWVTSLHDACLLFFSLLAPKDVNAGEGSEFADSGIEGAATDTDLLSRRSNATNSSYSPPTGRAFVGSDSGSSSTGDAARQGVYENFRRELEMSTTNSESLEEAGSAHSDEQSSGTLSSPGQSDILLTAAQGTVRKAGALAVKNFLVHKKNKKVESATRRKWKHYWVSLKGEGGSVLPAALGTAWAPWCTCANDVLQLHGISISC